MRRFDLRFPAGPLVFTAGTLLTGLVALRETAPAVLETAALVTVPLVFGVVFFATACFGLQRMPLVDDRVGERWVRPLGWAAIAGGAVLVLVIVATALRRAELFAESPSFALRAVATSLHPLVPLESRWIYSVLPLFLFHPVVRGTPGLRAATWLATALLVALVQTKFAFLFFGGLAVLELCFSGRSLTRRGKAILAIGAANFVATGILLQLADAPKSTTVVQSPSVALPQSEAAPELAGACREGQPEAYPTPPEGTNRWRFTIAHAPERLAKRAFATPARMYRLFLCLREHGWRPAFRGHQSARLAGTYVPFYRYAGREYREGFGSSVTSAVVAAPIDAFFNAGWLAVVVGAALSGLAYAFFARVARSARWELWGTYGEIQVLLLLWQASVPTALLGVLPAVALFALRRVPSRTDALTSS